MVHGTMNIKFTDIRAFIVYFVYYINP